VKRIGVLGAVLGLAGLTACGTGAQGDGPAAAGPQLDGVACSEVLEANDEHQRVMARTFGGGPEGREAMRAVVEVVEARPDCFRADTVEAARGMREMLPASDAEREAIEVAEGRCADGEGGGWATFQDTAEAATAEDALADRTDLPLGEPERAVEADDWVAFDFFDDGVFEGRAMVQRAGDGWYVRRVIDCRGDEAVVEEDGDGSG
jgi:hypothetical protein